VAWDFKHQEMADLNTKKWDFTTINADIPMNHWDWSMKNWDIW
jgi:hypothetical protein